ncbi:MAG: histidine phosphatase family protein [Burkholderiales bacterium]|nr:histidine phosphatase family protein [Burkholderiales bacterium]
MGTLYLARHGQASFGADDYDQLSPLGTQQSRRLGEYFREREQRFGAVLTGTLKRHQQTWAGIADGMRQDVPAPGPFVTPDLNEFDAEAIIRAVHPGPLRKPETAADVRAHFRLLRDGLLAWMQGRTAPSGMMAYTAFRAGVARVLDRVRAEHADDDVLIVSSGGPISTAIGLVLGTAHEATIDLNMRMRNSAVTEFAVTPKRHTLITYNTLPHLDTPAHRAWATHA